MTGLLQLLAVFIVVPFLTYWAIGLYVKVQMYLKNGFSLWGDLLVFHPIDLPDGVTQDDVMDNVKDYIEDAT